MHPATPTKPDTQIILPVSLEMLASLVPNASVLGDASLTASEICHPMMMCAAEDGMVLILEPEMLAQVAQQNNRCGLAVVANDLLNDNNAEVKAQLQKLFQACLMVERPRRALAVLLNIFQKPITQATGIHPSAVVEVSATVSPTARIGAFVYVGHQVKIDDEALLMPHTTVLAQARIGKNTRLHPGVRIGERVVIGNHCEIHHNASIGADGFSFVTEEPNAVESARTASNNAEKNNETNGTGKTNTIHKINSIGTVIIEDHVEIGACATVDRSNLGATLIKKGTKIDNLVMIGHNNHIGQNCMIVSQAGIAGSCTIGDGVVIAGQAGLADHLTVGDDAIVMAKAGVMKDIAPKEAVVGIPALPRREAMQNMLYISRLKGMAQDMRDLKKRLAELEEHIEFEESTTLKGQTEPKAQ